MGNLYFDESIRERGGFIIGAAVYSRSDLSERVKALWRAMGADPERHEYKSSSPKHGDKGAHAQRLALFNVLTGEKVALLVCPLSDRRKLGFHAVALTRQLMATDCIDAGPHTLYLDQNIPLPAPDRCSAAEAGIQALVERSSLIDAGLQLADLAAHTLGGMLLEQMGLSKKLVTVGENSGYQAGTEIDLGFELWASLRYSLINKALASQDGDPVGDGTQLVDGYGLYVAPSCAQDLAAHVLARFARNYLGCIH